MRRLLTWFRRIGAWVTQLTHKVTTWTHRLVVAATSRLSERWHSDGVYRRTLIAAASALSATVLPHPAAAAAVGALLADHTPIGHRRRVEHEYSDWDEDDDYPRHHRAPPSWEAPGRLWGVID